MSDPEYFPANGPTAVAPGARQFWTQNGFLAVPELFSQESVDEVAALLNEMLQRTDIPEWTRFGMQLEDGRPSSIEVNMTTMLDPRLKETAVYRRCHEYAAQLLGEHVEFDFDHVIRKPAGVGRGTDWHQDCAYHHSEPDRDEHRVHFWIPMADVGPRGSAMRYIPESHRVRMYEHTKNSADATKHYLVAKGFDDSNAVEVPIRVGGAILHHPVTMHASTGNASTAERTAWILHFARPRTTIERARWGKALVSKRARALLPSR